MAKENSEVRTETSHLQAVAQCITIKNDIKRDVLMYFQNGIWGSVSCGYVRAGQSFCFPASVNSDAFALYEGSTGGVILTWPGPTKHYNLKKVNLTPGQTYALSNFS